MVFQAKMQFANSKGLPIGFNIIHALVPTHFSHVYHCCAFFYLHIVSLFLSPRLYSSVFLYHGQIPSYGRTKTMFSLL